MSLYFITGNQGKLAEAKAIIPQIEGLNIDLPEIQSLDAHDVIKAKLQAAFETQHGEFIVEDTSLYFDGLNGLPGPLIKWFLESIGVSGLSKLAETFEVNSAVAKTIIGYAKGPDHIQFFEGEIKGTITSPKGNGGFGFDPIFQPEGNEKVFAEMSVEEKNNMSMRKIAFINLSKHLNI